jgi:hypothetical protein
MLQNYSSTGSGINCYGCGVKNKTNGENLENVRGESSRHFGNGRGDI